METEGQVVANYRLVRKLGEGGMGAVYEGVHEQIGRRSAVKLLHAEFSQNPQICNRFFNEARAVNIVQHPGVVQVFEVGQLPDHTAYMVMEFLEGETLSARIKRAGGPLGPDALRIARQVASALAAAHLKGVVHRDLKPDNVMMVPDSETQGGERAKLVDFGIAKMLEEPEVAEMKTRTGMLLGTPTYMSPEQCRGTGGITEKTDVYSLGLMLYMMLCGKLPYKGGGAGEVIAQHLFVPARSLKDYLPNVNDGLAALVHRMMNKKPEERPTMVEVTQALEVLGAPRATMTMQAPTAAMLAQGVSTLEQAAGQIGKPPGTSQPGVNPTGTSGQSPPGQSGGGSAGLPSLGDLPTQLGQTRSAGATGARPLSGRTSAGLSQIRPPGSGALPMPSGAQPAAGRSGVVAPGSLGLPAVNSGGQRAPGATQLGTARASTQNPVPSGRSSLPPTGSTGTPRPAGPSGPTAPISGPTTGQGAQKPGLSQLVRVAGLVLVLLQVGGGIMYALGVFKGSTTGATDKPSDPQPRATKLSGPKVRWQIRSNPPGAKLVRVVDGELMGTTPFVGEVPKSGGIVDIELQLEGYQSKRIVLNRDVNTNSTVELEVVP